MGASQYGNIIQCVSSQCNEQSGSSLDLMPETSTTKSFGAVFTPTFFPGFNLSVDWFDINVKGVITTLPLAVVLDTCANSPTAIATGSQTYCSLIHRDPVTGQLFGNGFVSLPIVNAGLLHTEGVDMEGNYRVNLV